MKRKEKKSESLDIRLPYTQKQAFMDATRKRGETASQALRRFITSYIEDARQADNPNPVQEITMTLARHRFKTLATATGAAIGVFALSALPSAADGSAFDRLDKNKDGMITEGEILPGDDSDIIAQLDTDKSGSVSRKELEAAGNRIVVERQQNSDVEGGTAVKKTVKVLEFRDGKEGESTTETKSERKIVIKRTGDAPLSEEDMDKLIEDALADTGVSADIDIDVEID